MSTGVADLLGVWELLSLSDLQADVPPLPYGDHPAGLLIYAPGGRVAVQVYGSARPRLSTTDLTGVTPEEAKGAFDAMFSYFGTFDVDVDHQTVTHTVDAAHHTNLVGRLVQRRYQLDGAILSITTDATMINGRPNQSILRWRRVAALAGRQT